MDRGVLMHGATKLLVLVAGLVSLAAAVPLAMAHEGAGEDVAYAHLKATQATGIAAVQVEILDPVPCDAFRARGLIAERAGTSVSGVIQSSGECRFEGAIELPDTGRWVLKVQLGLGDRLAEASMPVGVTDAAGDFEVETWFHAADQGEQGFLPGWIDVSTLGLYTVVGLSSLAIVAYALRSREGEARAVDAEERS